MSGLTVGYTSIDQLNLEIILENGTKEQKNYANKILPIIKRKHLLLATLLLSNALAMESLPIFLDAIMPATLAIILSTTVVLIFGEVVPQALCLGEN
jgi:metal transporter CNNM